MPSLVPTLISVFLSLAFVVLLIYAVYWLLRRWRATQGLAPATAGEQGIIKVLEKNYVDNRRGVAVVEMGGEAFFIGLGEDVTLLARISDPEAVEKLRQSAPTPGGFLNFQEHLERVGVHLRRDQWKKSKQDLKSQTAQLDDQIGRLKPTKKKDAE